MVNNFAEDLISAFFKTGMRTDVPDGSLAGTSFLSAMMLTIKIRNVSLGIKYISIILENFNNIYQIQEQNVRQSIFSGILSVLQANINVVSTNQPLSHELLDSIFKLIANYFEKIADVDSNGIYILA